MGEKRKEESNGVREGDTHKMLVSLGNCFVSVEGKLAGRQNSRFYFLFLAKSRFISVALEYSKVVVPWTLAFISIFVEVPGCSSQDLRYSQAPCSIVTKYLQSFTLTSSMSYNDTVH